MSYIVVASGILTKSYTLTGLITGNTYIIKVEARNEIGFSSDSNLVTAIAAIVPIAPSAPSTIRDVNNIIIDWSSPTHELESAYGSPILGYKVFIRWQDGTYTEEETNCDGSNEIIFANTQCTIPLEVLMAHPFNLQWGSSIYASIVAYNLVGDSPNSDVGNGAIVIVSTVPDPPRYVARSSTISLDMTRISIVWEDGASDGNQPILDYRVSFD